MLFPGDTKNFVLSIVRGDGTAPSVTSGPVISVIRLADGATLVNSVPMIVISGTQVVYNYAWDTGGLVAGDYMALVSYAADSVTVNSRMLETFRLGNSYIRGPVALDATVAKDGTVAKDATVAHVSDVEAIDPSSSSVIQAIKAKTDNLPSDPASITALTSVQNLVQTLADAQFGTWTVDKTTSPQTLTIISPLGATVATFQLTDDSAATQRLPV